MSPCSITAELKSFFQRSILEHDTKKYNFINEFLKGRTFDQPA